MWKRLQTLWTHRPLWTHPDELLLDVWFKLHPSARRKRAA
jgi:hypothetical protein